MFCLAEESGEWIQACVFYTLKRSILTFDRVQLATSELAVFSQFYASLDALNLKMK